MTLDEAKAAPVCPGAALGNVKTTKFCSPEVMTFEVSAQAKPRQKKASLAASASAKHKRAPESVDIHPDLRRSLIEGLEIARGCLILTRWEEQFVRGLLRQLKDGVTTLSRRQVQTIYRLESRGEVYL